MRKLNADDLFNLTSLIRVTGVKDEFAKMQENVSKIKKINETEVGTELILNIVSNCGTKEAKTTILEFLSGPCEVSIEELAKMELREFVDTIEKFVELNSEDLKYFFKKALGLIGRK